MLALGVVDLTDRDYLEIIVSMGPVSLSIGMRGHSQMIPLGLKNQFLDNNA